MLTTLKYATIFLAAKTLGLVGNLLPEAIEQPIRIQELALLQKVRMEGPGGFDDAVQTYVMSNPVRYSRPVLVLLAKSSPGSEEESLALSFIEEVRAAAGVDEVLTELAQQHPDAKTRELASAILRSPIHGRSGSP